VGDIIVSVYLCQGTLRWHTHIDNDELFWAYEGTFLLESDWGKLALRPGELAVVPKGVRHRSGSVRRASVLLLRCGFAPNRKNGRRRLYTAATEGGLNRASFHDALRAGSTPFELRMVVWIEDTALQVARGEGTWPVEVPASHDLLLFALEGTATVRTAQSMVHLHAGEFTAVPRGEVYQLSTTRESALVRVGRLSA
jgi:mannose-6-phosphate isomerase-like protein (cupin superfamily)